MASSCSSSSSYSSGFIRGFLKIQNKIQIRLCQKIPNKIQIRICQKIRNKIRIRLCKKIQKYILQIQRPFRLQPIGWWLWNLLGINFLMLRSREFMMVTLMAGRHLISTDVAIRKDGPWLSFRQPLTSSLAASQQLNGNPTNIS